MNLGDALALLTIGIAAPLNCYVAFRLWQVERQAPSILVLRERAIAQTVLALIVIVFGLIFLNNDIEVPFFDREATRIITRFAVLSSIIPALYWWRLYRRGSGIPRLPRRGRRRLDG